MTNFTIRTLLFSVAFSLAAVSPLAAYAQQDPATAAKQAQIDAEQAQARIQDLNRDARGTAQMDGIDAPELRVDAEAARIQEQKLQNDEINEENDLNQANQDND